MFKYELFSYWLFIWFLFYYCGLIKASPLIFFIFAIIGIIITRKYNKRNLLIKLIITILLLKIPIIEEEDLLFGFFISYFYIITLLYFNKNPIDVYLKINLKTIT
jgi:hypothetical protein